MHRSPRLWILFLPMLLVLATSCSALKRNNKARTERTEDSSALLYAFVEEWKGVPYKYGGTTRSGVDCSGFVGVLYREVYNREIPRTTSSLSSSVKKVSKEDLEEGNLVFFDIDGKKHSHVGVYLRNGDFVHASTSKGVVVSNLENPYYKRAFAQGGKL